MPRRPISIHSENSNTDRLEPKLLRAVEANSIPDVQDIIQQAKAKGQCTETFLSIGLVRACDKALVDAARFLLLQGANPDYTSGNKPPSLLRAAEYGLKDIAETLIDHDANLEARDKKGRTPLMTAAWRGHMNIVQVLLSRGANIDTVDLRRRNVLHNVAADKGDQKNPKAGNKPRRRCGMGIVQYLLQAGVDVEAEDELGRTALHWTCVTDHEDLMKILLTTRLDGAAPKASVDPRDNRDKTPLHLAAANGREALVTILLEHGANVLAKSDGGWTALHSACTSGTRELVQTLLDAKADVNSELLNGRTPLHVAAEFGNKHAAACLLEQNRCRRDIKDRFGNTPLMMAAQHGRREITELLAPWNHLDDLSRDEIEASRQFNATIVDFGNFKNENRVLRRPVFELLYARDPTDQTKHSISTLPKNVKATNFRWIHLPANNIAWCDALLTKRFIEEGGTDIEGYKALATSFNHQHRGQQHHSRFMRPMCQAVQRATADFEDGGSDAPVVLVTEPAALETVKEAIVEASVAAKIEGTGRPERQNIPPVVAGAEAPKSSKQRAKGGKQRDDGIPEISEPGSPITKAGKPTIQRKETSSTVAASESSTSSKSNKPNGSQPKIPRTPRKTMARKDSTTGNTAATTEKSRSSNIFLFLPYLHFETDRRRREMQNVLENPDCLQNLDLSTRADEILFRAHLARTNSFLHVRRTLDQFFYHNIDTRTRDCDQVVFRFQQKHHKDPEYEPKIFMVDQLWMWILGKDLVVTSFPQRWRQPRNDPLNVLEGIIEDINSKTRDPVQNVYELATTIAGRCFGTFDRHRKGDDDFQFLDMFEASIGAAMDGEATLFQEFSQASRQASEWLQNHQRGNKLSRNLQAEEKARQHALKHSTPDSDDPDAEPQFVDKLLDVGAETDLLAEIKDIRDELDIIRMVLSHQDHLLPELREAIKSVYRLERSHAHLRKIDKVFDEQEKTISNPLKDINRMDLQAGRIYEGIRDLLDLKQKHANAFEARFARDQAAGTQRQGQTVMVFTIVTVIFLPLTFIAAIFAINIDEFPHNAQTGNPQMSFGYVARYIFGVGLAISIPCIALALTVDEVGYGITEAKRKVRVKISEWKQRRREAPELQQNISLARKSIDRTTAGRKSFEMGVLKRQASGGARRDSESVSEGVYGTRRMSVWDLERGKGRRREAVY
ncbi:hypothetical protein PRZ48_002456 [Zasmidium cellare]|uniref:Ankyrin repeat protein n=1 Tax=Zasmidium cellare TaxID=395010 RepID=A0ABR0F4U3_ZASCE|nr:hypothetical protein PRZ48_002456 [Zasmidium cellare]